MKSLVGKSIKVLLAGLVISCLSFTVSAVEDEALTVDEQHRGKIQISENFTLFPEGRPGNSVYNAEGKAFSEEGLMIKDAVSVPGGILVYGVNESDENIVRYSGTEDNSFEIVAPGYWHLKTPNWVSKLFRINAEDKIEDILPVSRTGNGLVYNGKDRVAFFHIFNSKKVEKEDGTTSRDYYFKVHILKNDWKERKTQAVTLVDTRPYLRLSWVGERKLKYSLGNGKSEILTVP